MKKLSIFLILVLIQSNQALAQNKEDKKVKVEKVATAEISSPKQLATNGFADIV